MATMHKGKFISFEGGEGSGKSTQIKRVSDFLKANNIDYIMTREPGGSEGAEALRNLMITGDPDRWTAMSEALIVTAGRVDHVEKVIKPALSEGKWVLSDRFFDSTKTYQGKATNLGIEKITRLQEFALGDFTPDLTLILDIDPEDGLSRAMVREMETLSGEDRFERMGLEYHTKIRDGYLEIARMDPERCRVIDANRPIEDISADIVGFLLALMAGSN